MNGMFSASRKLLTPRTRCMAVRREDCTLAVSLIVKLVPPLLGCTLIVVNEISCLKAPAANSARRISAVHPFICASAADVVDCVLDTFADHWNSLDVTACTAEPVTEI